MRELTAREIILSIIENTGPHEVYFRDSKGNIFGASGPLTEVQLKYLWAEAFARDPKGQVFRDPEFDRQMERERQEAKERGKPWAIDLYPENFSKEAALKHHGFTTQ